MSNHQNSAESSVLGWTKKAGSSKFCCKNQEKKRLNINCFLAFNDGDVFLLINLISDLKQSNKEPEVLDLTT